MSQSVDERALFIRGPVVVFKWQNAPGWPVEYVSANAEEVFGYRTEQFLEGEVAYASLIHPDDLERVAGRYQVVNVKLDKAGGLTEALRMADRARALGLGVLAGCMVSSSLSIAPALWIGAQADADEGQDQDQNQDQEAANR